MVIFDKFVVFATRVYLILMRRFFLLSEGRLQFSCAKINFVSNDLFSGFDKIELILIIVVWALLENVYSFGVKKLSILN
jgi:hypothetical protein